MNFDYQPIPVNVTISQKTVQYRTISWTSPSTCPSNKPCRTIQDLKRIESSNEHEDTFLTIIRHWSEEYLEFP